MNVQEKPKTLNVPGTGRQQAVQKTNDTFTDRIQ